MASTHVNRYFRKTQCIACEKEIFGGHTIKYCYDCRLKRVSCAYFPPGSQAKAQFAVSKAIRDGELPKLDGTIPCEDCGKPAEHYDHRDYTKPLEVAPVCRKCNFKRGRAKNYTGDQMNLPTRRHPSSTRRACQQ